MTATEKLRELLDERGVDYFESPNGIAWGERSSLAYGCRHMHYAVELDGLLCVSSHRITPKQAIAATLGREQRSDPVWEQWYEGLRHDEIKTIGDAVEQLMYESIKNGGYMGPNGNTYGGVDEGEVATLDFINSWVAKFGTMLGADRGTCHDACGTDENGRQVFHCDACGCVLSLSHRDGTTTLCTNFIYDYPRYCPECGRRVVDE